MKPRPLALLAFVVALHLLAVAGLVFGDDPPKPAPPAVPVASAVVTPAGPVPPGAFVQIDATASVADSVLWDTDLDPASYRVDSNGLVVTLAAPLAPGTYTFRLDAFKIRDGKIAAGRAKPSFTVTGTIRPVDPPSPPAPPVPAPAPVVPAFAGKLHAVLIWDAENDEPSSAAVRVSQVATTLAAANTAWYVRTKAQEGDRFAAQLAATPAPAVYFLDDQGKVKGSLPLTAASTPADVVAKVKSIRTGN